MRPPHQNRIRYIGSPNPLPSEPLADSDDSWQRRADNGPLSQAGLTRPPITSELVMACQQLEFHAEGQQIMDKARLTRFIDNLWDEAIVPTLVDYIRIPNKSPGFDPDWVAHGYMREAVALFERWAREKIAVFPGATLEVVQLEGRTPLIFIELPGNNDDTVLLYGHLDKQPEMKGWTEGTGPWTPVIKDDKLFGRGGADDGYAMFAALSALLALHDENIPRARAVIIIEACEESGSYDLPFYVDHLTPRIGTPSLVVCLDSGCGDY